MNQYYVLLQPEEKGFDLKLGELWTYRYLVLLLTKKTFTMTYRQTMLGPLWIILRPILSTLIHMFIFGHIAKIGTNGIPQVLFYFVSSSVWEILAFSLTTNANTFNTNANLFGKVYFPRLAVPVSNMLVSLLKFAVQLVIVIALAVPFVLRGDVRPVFGWFILLPFLFLHLSILGMSAGVLLSGLTAKYRDLVHVVGVGLNLWMYASAVVYPMASIPEGTMKTILRINPATQIMELIRRIMLGSGDFDPGYYLAGLALTVVLFIVSVLLFNRVERTFADTV